ncbi:MAG: Uma2 family endonuclease [Saprospiraceae bacterium]|nr:Uma2 family endonuclease [Saprospiraceae bacterium]
MSTVITDITQLNPDERYTYADYLLWQFRERVEIFRGRFRQMAAPSVRHQRISGNIHREISWFLKSHRCDVFTAPFDVRLPLPPHRITNDKSDTVVQPDICIVCDRNKLDERGCIGAPELIIEILSPGNSKKEMRDKYDLYQEAGVLEYWVVFPSEQVLQRYLLDENGIYQAARPNVQDDKVGITFLPGFELDVTEIFEE